MVTSLCRWPTNTAALALTWTPCLEQVLNRWRFRDRFIGHVMDQGHLRFKNKTKQTNKTHFLLQEDVLWICTYNLCYRNDVSGMFQKKKYWSSFYYYSLPVHLGTVFVTRQGLVGQNKVIQNHKIAFLWTNTVTVLGMSVLRSWSCCVFCGELENLSFPRGGGTRMAGA